MTLNVRAFAIASAIIWGVGVFILTWWLIVLGDVAAAPTLLERAYVGYDFTPLGSLIGLAWAAADGLVGGALFAWLYNAVAARLSPRTAQ
ncbi:MAG: bacteriophage holin [Alphaproteobacteria bacterium]|nr:bacteriophage holin [Alphaproteobacteria bacterium]